jgi:hypothetical protein
LAKVRTKSQTPSTEKPFPRAWRGR